MSKKAIAMLLAIMVCVTGIWSMGTDVRAEEMGEDLDYSYLLTEDTLVGTTQNQTWGVYLLEGNSYINKMGTGLIGAGGDTVAATVCKVSITCILEKKVNGSWTRVTSWTTTNESDIVATVSKSVYVGTGYYYRIRSAHYAASDSSSSYTGALWIGN